MRIAEKFGLVLMKLLRIDPETLNIVAATTLHSYQIVILLHSLVSLVAFCHKILDNRLVSQMRAPLATCREPAGKLWQLCKVLYVFEHKA